MRIELRETGGVANLRRSIALEGNRLRVLDCGEIRLERELPQEAVRTVASRVRALEDARPRRAYGRAGYASDTLTLEVEISDDAGQAQVEVVFDPQDPAPEQFWDLVHGLRQLTRTGQGS